MPSDIFKGFLKPEFIPEDVDLNDLISVETAKESDPEGIDLTRRLSGDDTSPLTRAESEAIDQLIADTVERIDATRDRIKAVREAIDESISDGKEEMSFELDIRNRPSLKRAIQKAFGYTTNTITYSMYKEALELKKQLEVQDVREYVET